MLFQPSSTEFCETDINWISDEWQIVDNQLEILTHTKAKHFKQEDIGWNARYVTSALTLNGIIHCNIYIVFHQGGTTAKLGC
jgi:hypothetical protein